MIVQPIPGEPFRFHVRSESRGFDLLVDVEENNWSGWCGCEDYAFRKASGKGTCKHLRAAHDFLIEQTKHMKEIT